MRYVSAIGDVDGSSNGSSITAVTVLLTVAVMAAALQQ